MSEISAEERREAEASWRRAQMSAFVELARRHVDALDEAHRETLLPTMVHSAVGPGVDAGPGPVADDAVDLVDEDQGPDDRDSSPLADEPVPDDPAADEPVDESFVGEEPVPEDPVAEEPVPEDPVAEEPDLAVVRAPESASLDWLDDVSGLIAGAVFEVASGRVLATRSANRGLTGEVVASAMAWVMRALDVAVGMMGGGGTFGDRSAFDLTGHDARVIVRYLRPDIGLAVVVDQRDPEATDASLFLALKRALPDLATGMRSSRRR